MVIQEDINYSSVPSIRLNQTRLIKDVQSPNQELILIHNCLLGREGSKKRRLKNRREMTQFLFSFIVTIHCVHCVFSNLKTGLWGRGGAGGGRYRDFPLPSVSIPANHGSYHYGYYTYTFADDQKLGY